MAGLKENKSGQVIILSGFAICLSLIALSVLVNQAMITGYYSSNAALEFPKHEIQDIKSQTRESSVSLAELALHLNQSNNQSIEDNYLSLFNQYEQQMRTIYATHGDEVHLSVSEMNLTASAMNYSTESTVWVNLTYNNGMTYYASMPEIIEVKR
jgi:hypothetical protein